jgi:hypothetical protein
MVGVERYGDASCWAPHHDSQNCRPSAATNASHLNTGTPFCRGGTYLLASCGSGFGAPRRPLSRRLPGNAATGSRSCRTPAIPFARCGALPPTPPTSRCPRASCPGRRVSAPPSTGMPFARPLRWLSQPFVVNAAPRWGYFSDVDMDAWANVGTWRKFWRDSAGRRTPPPPGLHRHNYIDDLCLG